MRVTQKLFQRRRHYVKKKNYEYGTGSDACCHSDDRMWKQCKIGKFRFRRQKVVIYSNADDEAITAMQNALDNNGYKGKYSFEGFGTSELGGKLLAEGKNIEADMVTMSTFYLDSAQKQNNMFKKLDFEVNTIDKFGDYAAPITSQEGAII